MHLQSLYPFPFTPSSFIHSLTHSTKVHQVPQEPAQVVGHSSEESRASSCIYQNEVHSAPSGSCLCSGYSHPHLRMLFFSPPSPVFQSRVEVPHPLCEALSRRAAPPPLTPSVYRQALVQPVFPTIPPVGLFPLLVRL